MEFFLELLFAELLAVAVRIALVRLLAWIREPSGAQVQLASSLAA
jgi:hypothetical protein